MTEHEMTEIYRVYVTECLRSYGGSDLSYYELVHGDGQRDFNAEQVVDDVISRMGLETD